MHFIKVKGILSSKNGMNLFRGCTHGCIYCDSKSKCYRMNHKFEDIEVKENGISLLEESLKRKRKKCMIGLGSMTDPYIKEELGLNYTRQIWLTGRKNWPSWKKRSLNMNPKKRVRQNSFLLPRKNGWKNLRKNLRLCSKKFAGGPPPPSGWRPQRNIPDRSSKNLQKNAFHPGPKRLLPGPKVPPLRRSPRPLRDGETTGRAAFQPPHDFNTPFFLTQSGRWSGIGAPALSFPLELR